MRTLLAIVILAALAWSGWWFVQSTARDRAMEAWLADRRAAGWVAEAEDVRVRGFPNRVDTVITELSLSDPDAGWAWQADGLQVLSLSYKPTTSSPSSPASRRSPPPTRRSAPPATGCAAR